MNCWQSFSAAETGYCEQLVGPAREWEAKNYLSTTVSPQQIMQRPASTVCLSVRPYILCSDFASHLTLSACSYCFVFKECACDTCFLHRVVLCHTLCTETWQNLCSKSTRLLHFPSKNGYGGSQANTGEEMDKVNVGLTVIPAYLHGLYLCILEETL